MRSIARVSMGLAAATALATSSVVGVLPARASTAADCLAALAPNVWFGLGQQGAEPVVLTPTRRVADVYAVGGTSVCVGAYVSIGISRPNGSDFRNVNASVGTSSGYWFVARHQMR